MIVAIKKTVTFTHVEVNVLAGVSKTVADNLLFDDDCKCYRADYENFILKLDEYEFKALLTAIKKLNAV